MVCDLRRTTVPDRMMTEEETHRAGLGRAGCGKVVSTRVSGAIQVHRRVLHMRKPTYTTFMQCDITRTPIRRGADSVCR